MEAKVIALQPERASKKKQFALSLLSKTKLFCIFYFKQVAHLEILNLITKVKDKSVLTQMYVHVCI